MTESACRELGIDHELQHGTHLTRTEDRPVSTTVVGLVGTILDRDVQELPPLHDVLDTDALNAFVRPDRASDPTDRARVEFSYVGCEITVYEDGEIAAYETPDLEPSGR
jgi:hypothetical protein